MPFRLAIMLLTALALAPSGVGASRTPAPVLFGIEHSEFRHRRAAAAAALADGILVVRGSTEAESGEASKFRQNSWFFYLSGVEAPGAALLVDAAAPRGKRERLYLPPRNPAAERWTGPQLGPGDEAARVSGFESVASTDALLGDVVAAVAARKGDREVLPVYTIVVTGEDARFSRDAAFVEKIADALTKSGRKFKIADARPALAEIRRRKSDGELALLERAVAITGEAQSRVARVVGPGRFEYEAEGAIAETFLRSGAARAGFPSIVGSGPYSTVLHYAANTRKMEAGDLVVVDIGAEYNYYTADITRTWPVSGTFTDRQRRIYALVLEAQRAAETAYRPGVTMQDLHAAAVATFKSSPLRDSRGKTLETAFLHGLGHFVGLDVHDVGDYSRPLAPGDVITIEPGLYLADEKLGVRIEDDYLVTEKGLVKLSKAIPSDPADVERAMR